MTNTTIIKTVFFAAPRESVWAFITQKEKLALWFHPADADLSQGEDYELIKTGSDGTPSRVCWGTVELMESPTKLVYSFTFEHLVGASTKVTWLLESVEDGTKLTLTHEGIAEAAGAQTIQMLTSLDAGWDGHFSDLRKSIVS